MDAESLQKYPILERLGFFPVERDTASGAKEFLRTSRELLKNSETILWLTPAGKFHDVRDPHFMNGLSHLVDSDFPGTALPMAIEYTFWNERSPSCSFGSDRRWLKQTCRFIEISEPWNSNKLCSRLRPNWPRWRSLVMHLRSQHCRRAGRELVVSMISGVALPPKFEARSFRIAMGTRRRFPQMRFRESSHDE